MAVYLELLMGTLCLFTDRTACDGQIFYLICFKLLFNKDKIYFGQTSTGKCL